MRFAVVWRTSQRSCQAPCLPRPRRISTTAARCTASLASRTRNIGIIAHIDAGKTTTTERMLYYGGHTRRIGDVDEGSTVTDFLPAERARGITIQSAAITFPWPPKDQDQAGNESPSHNINLIDTPGHADFTFEVLRSLRVLDGAVCILDGVAGVEAQTEKVWAQARRYQIPRIVYVNKLDRDGAAFGRTVTEIGARLHGWPAVCQVPWWADGQTRFAGVGDVIGLRGLWWERGDGRDIRPWSFDELRAKEPELAEELRKARIALVELLSEHDDELVEEFLAHDENHLAIPASAIVAALRRCVLKPGQLVFPVFAGASFRNIGVQPLLDAVVALFPSPAERPSPEIKLGRDNGTLDALMAGDLIPRQVSKKPLPPSKAAKALRAFDPQKLEACALAFKVVHDARRGVLVYVRVYSGSISKGASLFNTNLGEIERPLRLFRMHASDAVEVQEIQAGQIGVIPGLRHTRTGDTVLVYGGAKNARQPPEPVNSLQLRPIDVPPPVFFASVEPESLSAEKHLNECLDLLLREDPSLNISTDPENGQTHLAGMGELHLEIARDRLLSDFKAKASMGQIEIGYREAILAASDVVSELFDREVAGKRARAASAVSAQPLDEAPQQRGESATSTTIELADNNLLTIKHPALTQHGKPASESAASLPSHLSLGTVLSALRAGVAAALCRGPGHSFPMHSTHVTLTLDPPTHLFPDSSAAGISNAARLATRSALRSAAAKQGTALMEPVMLASISVGDDAMGAVIHDLSAARGGQVLSLDHAADLAAGADAASLHVPTPSSPSAADEAEDEPPLVDPRRIYAPRDPFASRPSGKYSGAEYVVAPTRQRQILARVPLKEMVGYLKHLRSLTGGRGTFTMRVDRFERMGAQRMRGVLKGLRGGGGGL